MNVALFSATMLGFVVIKSLVGAGHLIGKR